MVFEKSNRDNFSLLKISVSIISSFTIKLNGTNSEIIMRKTFIKIVENYRVIDRFHADRDK